MQIHFVTSRPYSDKQNKDFLDRIDEFSDRYLEDGGKIYGWSARKNYQPGDLAIFYFAQPLMTIEAVAYVDSDPYVNESGRPADISNPVFCDYAPAWILAKELPIKEVIARQPKIAQWWKTKPYQTIRRIDPEIALILLQEIANNHPEDREAVASLIEYLSAIMNVQGVNDLALAEPESAPVPQLQQRTPPTKKNWSLQNVMALKWQEFEILVGELFVTLNDKMLVELTPPRGDLGVDVLITDEKSGQVQIVQCKRFRRDVKVSSVDMQKFAGAMKKFKATKGYFVTSSSFNPFALHFVEGMDDIELIDGKRLVKMINDTASFPSPDEFQQYLLEYWT
jgi:HJR/Mrr/RecB family endonuclease